MEMGQVVAARYGLLLAIEIGYKYVVLEMDNILVVHSVNSIEILLNELG